MTNQRMTDQHTHYRTLVLSELLLVRNGLFRAYDISRIVNLPSFENPYYITYSRDV